MNSRLVEGMAVEVAGEGDAVICVHGLGGTSNTFQPQMAVLSGSCDPILPVGVARLSSLSRRFPFSRPPSPAWPRGSTSRRP
jgi:pimeloyl-ACP methyl ester carboxylesterase